MELLKNPELIAQWLQLLVIAFGVVVAMRKMWREEVETQKLSKWDFIKANIPEVHNLVQKVSKLTKTPKDNLFIEEMDKVLIAADILPISPKETKAVKALASGYHQEYKEVRAMRDPLRKPAASSKK